MTTYHFYLGIGINSHNGNPVVFREADFISSFEKLSLHVNFSEYIFVLTFGKTVSFNLNQQQRECLILQISLKLLRDASGHKAPACGWYNLMFSYICRVSLNRQSRLSARVIKSSEAFLISMLICITIGWLWVTSLLPPPLLCSVCILIDHLGWLSGELTLKVIQCNNRPRETGAHVNVLQVLFARFINRLSTS